jgi:outer membrane usher protein
LLAQSERYATLSLRPETDRPVVDASASAGMTVSRFLGIGADLRAGHDRDLGPFASAGLRGSMQVGHGASLMVSGDYGRIAGGPVGVQLLVLLSWGRAGYSADASVNRDRDGHTTAALSTAKTLPRDTGYGYRFRAAGDDRDRTLDAALQGQTSFGRAELDVSRAGQTTAYHASAAGGLVYIDRRLFFSRPTENGFAIVDTGVPGVGVTLENGLVGRTGRDGILLVPDMQPYYASKLAIRDVDIPLEYEPGRTVRWVAPPLRGGSIVAFDVRRISAIAGQLVVRVRGEDQRPAYGELSTIVDGELRISPVTGDGRFFLERVPPGKHVVQAVWRGGSCRAVVTLPADAPPVWDAGEVRCIPDALDPSGRIPSLRDPGYANELLPAPQDSGAGSGGR